MLTRSSERTRACRCRRDRGRSSVTRRRDEVGFSLIESLVALALLGIAFGGISAGLLTTMRTSADNQQNVAATTALSNVAEQLKSLPYTPCASPTQVRDAHAARHPSPQLGDQDVAVVVASVTYWSTTTRSFTASCTPASDSGAQLVRLEVTVGSTTARGSVALGDRGAP